MREKYQFSFLDCISCWFLFYFTCKNKRIYEITLHSEFKDQDYRTGSSEEKPNRLIRLSGVPENATKEEVRHMFCLCQLKKEPGVVTHAYNCSTWEIICRKIAI